MLLEDPSMRVGNESVIKEKLGHFFLENQTQMPCVLGCTIFSKCSHIKPMFLHSMCISEIRSHAKFQVSSFKDLTWPPLFVNQSWHWESHLKRPESGTFDLAPFIGIKNALQNGITLRVLAFRKYLKRLVENWWNLQLFESGCIWYF